MATYNNQYAAKINITPASPNLRGMSDNFSNDGQTNLGGYGLGNIYELDYDRDQIERIFNQGTDAQYALMQKQAQVAENNYANQQFQNQFNTMEALRAQRNEQIASGMARGLNAAADQATALGVQQEAMGGALELAQNRQMQADQIAAEYAQNVVKALQEANSVKTEMAKVAAQLYEADMLGYTGELSTLGQLDANESNRYGYELGLEGTQYQADKALEGTKDYNQKYYDAQIYGADKSYQAAVQAASIQAAATRAAAALSAATGGGKSTDETETELEHAYKHVTKNNPNIRDNELVTAITNQLKSEAKETYGDMSWNELWGYVDSYVVNTSNRTLKDQTWEQWNNSLKSNLTPRPTASSSNLIRGQTMSYWRTHPDLAQAYGIQI